MDDNEDDIGCCEGGELATDDIPPLPPFAATEIEMLPVAPSAILFDLL
jgi:hypothetical protein